MRIQLLLGILVVTVLAGKAESSFVGSKWVNVFKSFFGKGDPVPVKDSPLDAKDARVKRHVFASMGAQINCEPGYTGQFCESPICPYPSIPPEIDHFAPRMIDRFYLRQQCSGNVTFPLDSESQFLHIQILTNEGEFQGNVTLVNDQGQVMPCVGGGGLCGSGLYMWYNATPGQYQLFLTPANDGLYYCDVEVYTETALAADVGFVRRPYDDAFEKGLAFNTPHYIIVHPYFLIYPATINAVYIYENERDHTRYVQRLQPRYGCGYEYYAGEFTCDTNALNYRWVVEGIDYRGYVWRRAGAFGCAAVPTTQPPSPPTPPTTCMNNGALLTQPDGTTICYCGEFFTGDQCQYALCMNGGTPTFDRLTCDCPEGYSGTFCQDVICTPRIPNSYFTDHKTLVVVIRESQAIVDRKAEIVQAINLTRNGYFGSRDVYSNYVLVRFGNNGSLVLNYYIDQYDQFIRDIGLIQVSAHQCNDDVVYALSDVFNADALLHKSPIFLFTDVPPNDGSTYMDVIGPNGYRKLPIYTFFLTDNSTECANKIDPQSRGYRTLVDISLLSGGLLFTPNVGNLAFMFQQTIVRVTYYANYVTFNEMAKCSMPNHQSFIVDPGTTSVSILAIGTQLSLTVTDPDWNVLNNSQLVQVIDDGYNYIWEIRDFRFGEYLYFIQALGGGTNQPCSFRVVSESNYDLWVGGSFALFEDMVVPDPVYGYTTNMVAHLSGFEGRAVDPFRLFAEMTIDSWNWNVLQETPVYYSSGIWRDGCTFHLNFGGFKCNEVEQRYIVTVYADDEYGATIQRSWPTYCAPSQYQTVPPNGNCYNGGAPSPYNSSVCICTPNWTGPNCTQIVCQNNGTAVGGVCQCPAQTTGQFCQYLLCQQYNGDAYFGFGGRGLAFVLNVRNTMAVTLQDVAKQARGLVRDLVNADGFRFISHYSIVWFNQLEAQKQITVTADRFQDWLANLDEVAAMANNQPITDPSNCTSQISEATLLAVNEFQNNNLKNSYVFVFTDADFANDTAAFGGSLFAAQDINAQINFVVTNYSLCGSPNPSQGPSEYMRTLARDTAGFIYYTTHAGNLLQVIPTLHKSGLVAGAETKNCKEGLTYSFPVDSWSQSFVVTAAGHGVQVSVQTPPGYDPIYNFENQIDSDTYLTVNQYIIPCEGPTWTVHGQFCYIIPIVNNTPAAVNWYMARDICHGDYTGFLANIFDKPTQDWFAGQIGKVVVWIGLYRDPGTEDFFWDTPEFRRIPLNKNETFWATGEPRNSSSGKDCVYIQKKDGTNAYWYTASCTETHDFDCQKHRYGQDLSPGDPSYNLLPPGIWQISIKSNYSEPCLFEARIQSEIQVYFGYTQDIHSDYPVNYGNLGSKNNYFVAHTRGLDPLNVNNLLDKVDGHLNYALIYGNDRTLTNAVTFQERDGYSCAYYEVSQGFACPGNSTTATKSSYYVKFSGIDQYGNLFERFASTYCSSTPVCYHGYASNGQCVCEDGWQGKTCSARICYNGGTRGPGGVCLCRPAFAGPSCQYASCEDEVKPNLFNDTGVTLAILLETSTSTGNTIWYLRNNLQKIINQVTQDNVTSQNWIQNYILYPFDSQSNQAYWYPPTNSTRIEDIDAALHNISTMGCPGPGGVCASGNDCPRPIMGVLKQVLFSPVFRQNSVVLVITSSNVGDYTELGFVHDLAEAKRTSVNVILVDKAAPCGNWSYNSRETQTLYDITMMTGGDFFYSTGYSVVKNLLPYYLPAMYRTAHIGTIFPKSCTDDVIYFPVDSKTRSLTVSYSGASSETIQVTLKDSRGNVVPFPEGYALYEYTYFSAFDFLNQISNPPGTWKLEVKSSSQQCSINVRIRSAIEVYVAFTNDVSPWVDSQTYQLLGEGVRNGIVLHANNLGAGTLTYVEIYGTRGDRILFSAEVLQRMNCNYEYWVPAPFECSYGVYVISVYGVDATGQNFLRNIPVECVPTRAFPQPPKPSCDTTELKYDILLLLDVSSKYLMYGNNTWANFLTATSRALSQFYASDRRGAYDIQGTQLAVIAVAGNSTGNTKLLFNFTESRGKRASDLLTQIQPVTDYGQNLEAAIQIAMKLTDLSYGYRSGTQYPNVRHLAVYATINGGITEGSNSADAVHGMTRNGAFGFVAIGANNTFYDDSYRSNLESLTGFPCLYFAIDNPIDTFVPNYLGDLTCSRRGMCGDAASGEQYRDDEQYVFY